MKKGISMGSLILKTIVYIWFIAFAVCIIYPLLWMLISGFKNNTELFVNTWAFPKKFLISNYIKAWNIGVGKYFFNSIFVTSVSVVLTIIISALCSFALSRFDFKYKKFFLLVMVGGMMLSPVVSLISLYKMLQAFGIYNTRWALIVPYVAFRIPFTTFLIKAYFDSIPRELEDSAYIDGCSSFRVFWNIIIPVSKPIIATSALLTAMNVWNDFMFALVFIENSSLRTIPVGLMNLRGALTTNWPVLLSGLTISALPMIIIFIVLQKQFIRGLTSGSVKG